MKGKPGSKGEDTEGDLNPIMVARRAIGIGLPVQLCHRNKEKTNLSPAFAKVILNTYDRLKPADKENMIKHCWHSPAYMYSYLTGDDCLMKPKGPSMPGGWVSSGIKVSSSGANNAKSLDGYCATKTNEIEDPDLEYRPD